MTQLINNGIFHMGDHLATSWISRSILLCLHYLSWWTRFNNSASPHHLKFLGKRITYYGNSSATFQLDILVSGDVSSNPGPDSTANKKLVDFNNSPKKTYQREQLMTLNRPYPISDLLKDHIKLLGINPPRRTHRGTKGGTRKGRCKTKHINRDKISANFTNLCVLNTQSVCNKTAVVCDYILEHDFDIIALTETWLSNSDKHKQTVGELTLPGYNFFHVPRPIRTGGGVGIIHKESITRVASSLFQATSFESLCCDLNFKGHIP